ncbi:MAG: alpha-glucosidase [Lachnospiraceae bacterium]|nr:alpha-glucosidase [Lachnospiraceae bacterium]
MKQTQWYKDGVFYQIWPRSFKDGNGDGMGDLYGVIEKLDYIKSLNVDGIWFSPLYPSPGAYCGDDLSDYFDIAPEFGGMEAFRTLLSEAHARGLRVIMDLVVNHTSDEHEWFQKSRQRIDPYTDYYIWRPKKPNGKLPNNWDSMFEGGTAWQWDDVRQEYYLHLFAIKQPDLNMDNPLVREEVKKILRFWLDLGVDGFREDVITFISKPEGLPDDLKIPGSTGILKYNHGPRIHEYLQEFRREVLNHYDCVTIAEAPLVSPKKAMEYISELSPEHHDIDMMIQFQCMCADCLFTDYVPLKFSLRRLKRAFRRWQALHGKAWNMLYVENHDHPRVISRYGSETLRVESGKAIAVSYLFQQGTPFIYQGQELGMVNWYPEKMSMYEDVQTLNHRLNAPEEKRLKLCHRASRDSARTPVQWTAGPNAGFTPGEPWFYVNENYTEINAEAEEKDPGSLLHFYREAVALRKRLPVVRYGQYKEYRKRSKDLYVYERYLDAKDAACAAEDGVNADPSERLLVVCSFSSAPQRFKAPKDFGLKEAELILKTYPDEETERAGADGSFTLKPYEARVYRIASGCGH